VRSIRDSQALEQFQSQLRLENVKKLQALPVSSCHDTEKHGTEESNQFFLELLPDSSPDVIRFLSCLRLRQNQQV